MRGSGRWAALAWFALAGCNTVGGVPDAGEADALVASAKTAYYRADYRTAEERFERALRIYERYDDQEGAAYAWNNLGSVALRRREYGDAELYFRRARRIFANIDHGAGSAVATNNYGTALRNLGRMDDARAAYTAAIGFAETADSLVVQAAAHAGIGLVLMEDTGPERAASLAEAERRFALTLALQQKADDNLGRASTLGNMGALAALRGDVTVAIARYTEALEIDRGLEYVAGIAQDLLALAELHVRTEDYDTAAVYADRAVRVHEEIGDDLGVQKARELAEGIAQARGRSGADAAAAPG